MGLCNLFPSSAVPVRQVQLSFKAPCNWLVLFEASFQPSVLLINPRYGPAYGLLLFIHPESVLMSILSSHFSQNTGMS